MALPQLQLGIPAAYDLDALTRTATECTSCAACVSVCPAYVHTKDERVTGRAKMWLARRLANGEEVAQSEADAAWLCVRCRACAEVCQAQLPLMTACEKLEEELQMRFGRPDAMIQEFVAGMERNPEYRAHVGLSLPIELTEQRWRKTSKQLTVNSQQSSVISSQPTAASKQLTVNSKQSSVISSQPTVVSKQLTVNGKQSIELDESFDLPEPSYVHGGKYHIATQAALPRNAPFAKFAIGRSDQCISCGQCVEACVYGVHFRNLLDLRRMNIPKDELCRACFRCIQECPRNALAISLDSHFSRAGRGAFNADVILSLQNQATEGKIPVQGAGYRGAFAGEAFDSMWTDMSEIVRPTRDGIHGREYIATTVDLG
ncbi:MAG TPA: 4Fe-4S dicluster domain-containing protein, partial [Anaerolineae bacterium]